MTNSLPVNADPENIGKVVSIQVFERRNNESDSLKPETLRKYVGRLLAYSFAMKEFVFVLEGDIARTFWIDKYYVEIIPLVESPK